MRPRKTDKPRIMMGTPAGHVLKTSIVNGESQAPATRTSIKENTSSIFGIEKLTTLGLIVGMYGKEGGHRSNEKRVKEKNAFNR